MSESVRGWGDVNQKSNKEQWEKGRWVYRSGDDQVAKRIGESLRRHYHKEEPGREPSTKRAYKFEQAQTLNQHSVEFVKRFSTWAHASNSTLNRNTTPSLEHNTAESWMWHGPTINTTLNVVRLSLFLDRHESDTPFSLWVLPKSTWASETQHHGGTQHVFQNSTLSRNPTL
jgi:hypothetical protein